MEVLRLTGVLDRYEIKGKEIPASLIRGLRRDFAALEIDFQNAWQILCKDINVQLIQEHTNSSEQNGKARIEADKLYVRQAIGELLLNGEDTDGLTWLERISWCETPDDYRKLFATLNIIQNDRWKQCDWLAKNAKLPIDEGGVGLQLNGLIQAIRKKHNISSYREFVAWMEDDPAIGKSGKEIVADCKTPQDFINLFRKLGIPDDKWRSSSWMGQEARLSTEEGGIGKNLQYIAKAIREDERFGGSYPIFVAWMDGKEAPDKSLKQLVDECKTREYFLTLFSSLGIPSGEWRHGGWLLRIASQPVAEGGINKPLEGLYKALCERFGSHQKFVMWMDKAKDPIVWAQRSGRPQAHLGWPSVVRNCKKREDFTALFIKLGLTQEQLENGSWLENKAHLPIAEGGVGISLSGFVRAIRTDERWGAYPVFVSWMQGEEEVALGYPEQIAQCKTPEDFLQLFSEIGIPGDAWKSSKWLSEKSKLPVEDGGIGKTLSGLKAAILKDERFQSHRVFVAWMEGDKSFLNQVRIVQLWKSPKEAERYFLSIGVPHEKWLNKDWLKETASKTPREGGIKKDLSGLTEAIKVRFGNQSAFIMWMKNEELEEINWSVMVQNWQTPEEALKALEELGMKNREWKSCAYLNETAILPSEEGGVGRSLIGLGNAIRARFKSHPKFVEWMGEESNTKWRDAIQSWKTPSDALKLFEEEGIPTNAWRSSNWLCSKAKLASEEGGIGKSLYGLYKAISSRFETYPTFVAWMDGKNEPELTFREVVESWLIPDDALKYFKKIGIPGERWREGSWISDKAKLPLEEGGINKSLIGLYNMLKERFGSFKIFVAWMDGKEAPEQSWAEIVRGWESEEDAKEFLGSLGIDVEDEQWKIANWMRRKAQEPTSEGGIGQNLDGLKQAIERHFGHYTIFVAILESRLPFSGIQSEKQAQKILQEEILRLRETDDWVVKSARSQKITQEEYDEIARPQYYRKNIVVRAVADFFQSSKQDE